MEDFNVIEMAISRVEARDAFIHKGISHNPYSLLNSDNDMLVGLASSINVELGANKDGVSNSLLVIKSLEVTRVKLMFILD
jgi:hypothetical protein